MAEVSLASRIFRQNDVDMNGVLDSQELRKVVGELAKATGVYLSSEQVNAEVAKCMKIFGGEHGVTEEGFQQYAASEPAAFEALFMWREVFSRYASPQDEMKEEDTITLVVEVCAVNEYAITREKAVAEAKELMKAANVTGKSSINFFEFVAYAREREALFGKLTQTIMKTVGGTRRRSSGGGSAHGQSAGMEAGARPRREEDAGQQAASTRKTGGSNHVCGVAKRVWENNQRFHAQAMQELAAGRKEGHWIWYIFPTHIKHGAGSKPAAAMRSLAEAQVPCFKTRSVISRVNQSLTHRASNKSLRPTPAAHESMVTIQNRTISSTSTFATIIYKYCTNLTVQCSVLLQRILRYRLPSSSSIKGALAHVCPRVPMRVQTQLIHMHIGAD